MTGSPITDGVDLLADLRVVDLTTGPGRLTARLLADLGADVIRVDSGSVDSEDLHRLAFDANKRSVRLDPSDDAARKRLLRLISTAGILVEDGRPGDLAAAGLTDEVLQQANPRLVVVSLSAFGQDGPYRDWTATEWVQLALGGVLCRSGLPGDVPPVLPPGELATQSAAVQAAWAALVGWYHTAATGTGERVDVSVLEATASVVDPGYGIAGSATGGVPMKDGPRGRPDVRHYYPIFACADGHVRICLLAPRQWRGMRAWLGEPEEFADPELEQLGKRFAAAGRIYPFIAERFATRTRAELMAAGAEYGFPIAALHSPAEVLSAEHFTQTGALVDLPVDGAGTVRLPNGFVTVDGQRAGLRHPAPEPGADDALVAEEAAHNSQAATWVGAVTRPLEGLRVLDLGVIVVGAETGRLLADMGAEVIKIESAAFPDGSRQSLVPGPISPAFAYGHRGKLSLGLDLRSPEGKDLFRRLVAVSDVVLSNFKPGTMESLGFSHDELAAINPGIITAESSAFGPRGPWSARLGYGPLVRALAGLSGLWAYPDRPHSFSDASTVYPDHTASRIGALTVLAALGRRRRTGVGAHIEVSQADTILGQLAPAFAEESLVPGSVRCIGNVGEGDAPRGLYPCAGDDEWLVIDVRDDGDWRRVVAVLGRPELAEDARFATAADRVAHRDAVDDLVAEWTTRHTPREAMTLLQEAGVPAGAMNRVTDLPEDPHLQARGFLTIQPQPQIQQEMPAEARHAHFAAVPDPDLRPAPLAFEHTREVAERVLQLDVTEIDKLVDAGVLQVPAPVSTSH
jgi:crotonobetainyl-CoA:carnitine CoA-transferase CaiB-like acyl-CoA transferase